MSRPGRPASEDRLGTTGEERSPCLFVWARLSGSHSRMWWSLFTYVVGAIKLSNPLLDIDAVYFLGADRFTLPQWLLAAMKFSGLFEDRFVDQVQIVTYFHDWDPSSPSYHDRRGEFVYYEHSNKPAFVPPTPRSATAVDGSKVIHAASGYVRIIKSSTCTRTHAPERCTASRRSYRFSSRTPLSLCSPLPPRCSRTCVARAGTSRTDFRRRWISPRRTSWF